MGMAIPTEPPSSCTQSRSPEPLRRGTTRPSRHCSSGACSSPATCTVSPWEPPLYRANRPPRSRNGPRETSASCAAAHESFRGRLGPETADRDPGQRKTESRGISATLRQRWSCHPPDECVFGGLSSASPDSAWSPYPTLGFACGHPCGLQRSLAKKGELLLGICLKHGPARDLTCKDLRDLILGWIHAAWLRSMYIDFPDGTFHVARDQKNVAKHLPHSSECRCDQNIYHPPRPVDHVCCESNRAAMLWSL